MARSVVEKEEEEEEEEKTLATVPRYAEPVLASLRERTTQGPTTLPTTVKMMALPPGVLNL